MSYTMCRFAKFQICLAKFCYKTNNKKNNVNAKNKKVQNYFAKLMPSIYYTLFILLSAGDLVRRTKCFLTMRRLIKENVGQVTNVCQRDKVCFLLRALTANKDVHDSYVKLLLLNLEMIELHF